jgi:hypothetical protein
MKIKGFPGKLTRAQYLQLLKGETITGLRVNKWFRNVQGSTIQIQRNLPYQIKFTLNKRNQVFVNGQ